MLSFRIVFFKLCYNLRLFSSSSGVASASPSSRVLVAVLILQFSSMFLIYVAYNVRLELNADPMVLICFSI